MSLEDFDVYEVAKEAFIAGVEFAEEKLGGSIAEGDVTLAFSEWLDRIG